MALVVETGSGAADGESYISLTDASAYASRRQWTDWATASDETKEAALLEAAAYLDQSFDWKGVITKVTQPMAWPRTGATDREGRTITSTTIPAKLKDAQVELARLVLSGALVASQSEGAVTSVTAGPVSVTFKGGQAATESGKFPWVRRLLDGLHGGAAGGNNVRLRRA